jgi:outer membrane biosynthesis protein TonB
MARRSKLKVFRTPIGFHDAYVAAPSQKAALDAWGSENNLFASGAAERVDDPELTREPLANPGQVIRRARGTMAEHLAALPEAKPPRGAIAGSAPASPNKERAPSKQAAPSPKPQPQPKPNPKPKPKPRPTREMLDRAEASLAAIDQEHRAQRDALAQRQVQLDRERQTIEAAQDRERRKIERRLETQRDKYTRALRAWRGD